MSTRGESFFSTGFIVTNDPTVITPPDVATALEECCYHLPLLVESGDPATQDLFKNDKTSYFEFFDSGTSAASLVLAKCVNNASVDQVTISDNTLGTYSAFGAETHDGKDYISIKNINWTLIFDTYGAGEYQFKTTSTSIFSSTTPNDRYDFIYNLQEFTADRANHTVFMRIFNTGNSVDYKNNGKTKFTYPDSWVDGKRINSIFGNNTDEMEESYTVFNSGFEEYLDKKLKLNYTLETDQIPEDVRDYLQFVIRMADYVEMTNYVNNSANDHRNTPVQATGGYDPNYIKQVSKAKIEAISFKHAYESNFTKKHC